MATDNEGPVLVLNAGSSSIKASLLTGEGTCLWHEQRSWAVGPQESDGAPAEPNTELEASLADWLPGALAAWQEDITLVGHRVVHGGERFTAPTRLTTSVFGSLADLVPLAPLHNGPALRVMRWVQHWQPHLDQWACFDTAFHSTLPPEAHTYALPYAWRQAGLRRFGFHGLNHQHISEEVAGRFGAGAWPSGVTPLRLISCHLGAGCSLCAIRDGRSIATTMGFTPMEGLVMATRSGSVDPGLLLHQLRSGMALTDLDQALNSGSGLLGLSQLSGSMKELREAAGTGHPGARLAIDVFRHSLLQGIGAMAASLGGVDVIALTGGIGEHDGALRSELEEALAWLRPFELLTIAADEEGLIARSCRTAAQTAAAL